VAEKIEIKGIMSYPHLFEPRAVNQGDDPKYSVNILIRKDDPQVAAISQAIQTEIANTFPNGFPANGKVCLKENPEYPDYFELRTNSMADNPPHVVTLPGAKPVQDRSKVYAGAEAWFVVSISGYNQAVNKGIGGYINGVGITGAEGALGRLDNKPSAEQMFAGIGGGAAVPTPGAGVPTAGTPAPIPGMPAAATAPPVPGMPAAPAAPEFQMTEKAQGFTREQYHAQGWTDAQLIEQGMMLPPGGVPVKF